MNARNSVPSLVVVFVLVAGAHTASATTAVEFSQLGFDWDGVSYERTEWGNAALTYTPIAEGPTYFNLAINGVWQVQNVRLMAVDGAGEQTINFAYDLGVPRGTAVSSTHYDYVFTSAPMGAMPGGSLAAAVNPGSVIMNSGLQGQPLGALSAPSGPYVGSTSAGPEAIAPNFPNQDCGLNECAPAAVSNSLLYLNGRNKILECPEPSTLALLLLATAFARKASIAPTRLM